MWLINAATLELEHHSPPTRDEAELEFDSTSNGLSGRVQYSILSHRWSTDEVSFADMKDDKVRRQKKGFEKIIRSCQQSLQDGIQWIWCDTCCINKSSDAELSESINSMYTWYQAAIVCYAYIHDCSVSSSSSFSGSEWFSRGWTLQELVAPRAVKFFDQNWQYIGDKKSLAADINATSAVDPTALDGSRLVENFSIAERLSWAANRVTTRPEDRAYSLIGLCQVNMPMLYGEGGRRAFRRLQEEIIKQSDDHTIFAWPQSVEPENYGLLAHAPDAFDTCANMQSLSFRRGRKPYSTTNRGVSITLSMTPWCMDTYLAVLHCINNERKNIDGRHQYAHGQIGIFLHRLYEDDTFVRTSINGQDMLSDLDKVLNDSNGRPKLFFKDMLINVRQTKLLPHEQKLVLQEKGYGFRISDNLLGMQFKPDQRAKLTKGPNTQFDTQEHALVKNDGSYNYTLFGTLDLTAQKRKIKMMRIYLDFNFNPIIIMAEINAVDEKIRVLNKSGQFNIGEASERQWTDKEREEFKSFHERTITDEYGWNEIRMVHGQTVAQPNSFRNGLWMLRGDRMDGLDVILSGLSADQPGKNTRLRIWRDVEFQKSSEHKGLSFWNVDIENLASTAFSMKKMFK